MRRILDNLPAYTGMATFVIAFLVTYASTKSYLWSFVIALPLSIGDYLIFRGLFPRNADLEVYNLDARRRVKKVLASVSHIQSLAKQIQDPKAQASLLDGAKIIPQLLQQTQAQETTSFKVASTAANVQNYLTSVESVAEVYLRIQANPSYFTDADKQLAAGAQGFADFDAFALKAIQQLNAGDTAGYQANLETLKPLSLPAIPAPATGTS
jgi:hypothetical protein